MKILIHRSGREYQIPLPLKLLSSERFLGWCLRRSDLCSGKTSREAARQIGKELRRIKACHGQWTLVEVWSADGETVKITL